MAITFIKRAILFMLVCMVSFVSCTTVKPKPSLLDSLSSQERSKADSLIGYYDDYVRSVMGDRESRIGVVYSAFMEKYAQSSLKNNDMTPFIPTYNGDMANIFYSFDTLSNRKIQNPITAKIMLSVMEQMIRSGAMPELADWHYAFTSAGWFAPTSYIDLLNSHKKLEFEYDGLRLLVAGMMVERSSTPLPAQ